MSFLPCCCRCWRREPQAAGSDNNKNNAEAADSTEMQEVELARSADYNAAGQQQQSVGGASDAVVVVDGPASRRPRRCCHCDPDNSDAESCDEAWPRMGHAGSLEDSSAETDEEADGLANSNQGSGFNYYLLTPEEKQDKCYAMLLHEINSERHRNNESLLGRCKSLHGVAWRVWEMQRRVPMGFVAVPDCKVEYGFDFDFVDAKPVAKGNSVAYQFACLTYYDFGCHDKKTLPSAALHYWKTNGTLFYRDGRPFRLSDACLTESPPQSPGVAAYQQCKDQFHATLLGEFSHVGMHFGATKDSKRTCHPYAVVVVFGRHRSFVRRLPRFIPKPRKC